MVTRVLSQNDFHTVGIKSPLDLEENPLPDNPMPESGLLELEPLTLEDLYLCLLLSGWTRCVTIPYRCQGELESSLLEEDWI